MLSRLQFASPCKKSIRKKWSKNTTKTSTTRRSQFMVGSSMTAEAKKYMDGEIDALFYLTLWMWDTIPLTNVDCFFWRFALFDGVLDSREAMSPRQSSSSTSSSLTSRVSQIHLNYELMQNELRSMQDMLPMEQEDHRGTRELVNAFNAQIQAFMVVRNKNTFIAFLTFTDIYVCFTLFTLQTVVQHIPDASDILVPKWQLLSCRPVLQWSPWPSSGSSTAQVSYNLIKLSQT
jgi:hypothetical protein